jgi:ketosteroid isomerase-like protein
VFNPLLNSGKFGADQMSLSNTDVGAIKLLERRWLSEELAGNLDGVLELCSEDIMWLPPGLPALAGKTAIRTCFKHPSARVEDIRLSNVKLHGNESLAYKVADFCTRYVPAGSNSPTTIMGNHLWILRRAPQSSWQVALVSWTVFEDKGINNPAGS